MSYQSDLCFDTSLTIPLLRINSVENFADITAAKGKVTSRCPKRQVTSDWIRDGILKWTEFLSHTQRDRIKVQRHFGNIVVEGAGTRRGRKSGG
jgi:hypothetical protein